MAETKVRADGFDAGKELVLRPANMRKLLPNRIPALLVLPLVDRTVVAAGNILVNVGFWHADREPGVVETDGVFEYLPHQGPVAAIVAHPALPHKIYNCSHGVKFVIWTLRRRALILSTRVIILFIHSVQHRRVSMADSGGPGGINNGNAWAPPWPPYPVSVAHPPATCG